MKKNLRSLKKATVEEVSQALIVNLLKYKLEFGPQKKLEYALCNMHINLIYPKYNIFFSVKTLKQIFF